MFFLSRSKRPSERDRRDALLFTETERRTFEGVSKRPRKSGDPLDEAFVASILQQFSDIAQAVQNATTVDELDDLKEQAEQQSQLRAYVCPMQEIADEAALFLARLQEWNVPGRVISELRDSLLPKTTAEPSIARSALRAVFDEYDSWATYTDDYETEMKLYARFLSGAIVICLLIAIIALHFPSSIVAGVLFAGIAGSCISVISKMPALEVEFSGQLDAYERRVFSRIAVGLGATVIGSAFFSLLPVSIHNQTFLDVFGSCAMPAVSCTESKRLTLIAVPMVLGFAERALTWFEERIFGKSNG
jgi:hypothetical protein